MGKSNCKSSRYPSQRTADEAMGKNNSEINKNRAILQPSVIQYNVDDRLNIKYVSLVSHDLVPSKFEDLFKESGKRAKELFKGYAVEQAKTVIAQGRGKKVRVLQQK